MPIWARIYGVIDPGEDRSHLLRDSLIRACEGYSAGEAIRAMTSALTTIIAGTTADADAANFILDQLFAAMRANVNQPAPTKQ